MTTRYARVDLKIVKTVTPSTYVAPPPPLPMRAAPPPAPPLAPLARFAANERRIGSVLRRRPVQRTVDPADPVVTGDELRRARGIAGLSQRALALEYTVARACIAEAERGLRRAPPAVARWVARTLAAQALRDAEAAS